MIATILRRAVDLRVLLRRIQLLEGMPLQRRGGIVVGYLLALLLAVSSMACRVEAGLLMGLRVLLFLSEARSVREIFISVWILVFVLR